MNCHQDTPGTLSTREIKHKVKWSSRQQREQSPFDGGEWEANPILHSFALELCRVCTKTEKGKQKGRSGFPASTVVKETFVFCQGEGP